MRGRPLQAPDGPHHRAVGRELVDDPNSILGVGLIDDLVFGFIWARRESLQPQAGGEEIEVLGFLV